MKICPGCKAENPVEAKFCRACGCGFAPVEFGPTSAPAAAPAAAPSYDSAPEFAPVKPKKSAGSSRVVTVSVVVILLLVACGVAYVMMQPTLGGGHVDQPTEQLQNYIPETFVGNYSMRISSGEQKDYRTAVVKEYTADSYSVEVISEYGKLVFSFSVQQDGSVLSPELGTGVVKYKESINKLTIEFTREDGQCVLTRL